jgi:16S rRNA (adenine1518-N6/adenine1519-N6)-dimethyltransferase
VEFKHKKKWGQNFIKNTQVILEAVELLKLEPQDRLIEIGPGKGVFTEYIAANVEHLSLIEIDEELIWILEERFGFLDNVRIVNQDILKLDTGSYKKKYGINKVFGALPYNISKMIIDDFCGQYQLQFELCVFILQKEVAHKYAGIGNKLSFLNCYYGVLNDIYLIKDIEKSFFKPEPKVDSSLILFKPKQRNKIALSEEELKSFAKFSKNCFRNPRKKLKNNLKSIFKNTDWDFIFTALELGENTRVEELSRENIINIYNKYKSFDAKKNNKN